MILLSDLFRLETDFAPTELVALLDSIIANHLDKALVLAALLYQIRQNDFKQWTKYYDL